jgi:mRNA deadenylase 3'-5' endonuclease subunit Ccr4
MDGFSVKEMALNYFVLKVGNTDDRQKRKEDREVNNEDAQANDVEIMGHDKQVAGNEDINIASGEMTGVQERAAVQPMIYAVQNNIFAKFGWAKRASLKHPGFTPAMTDFLKWIFYRGNEQDNSKFSPSAILTQAANFGLPSLL